MLAAYVHSRTFSKKVNTVPGLVKHLLWAIYGEDKARFTVSALHVS